MKDVQVVAHQFDCLPAHIRVTGRGKGYNLRVAAARAVDNLLSDPRLAHKQIGMFNMSLVVISDKKVGANV